MEISDRLTVYLVGTMENKKPRLDVKKKKKKKYLNIFVGQNAGWGMGQKVLFIITVTVNSLYKLTNNFFLQFLILNDWEATVESLYAL